MAITNFEQEMLGVANELIDDFGQYAVVLSRSTEYKNVLQPWKGKLDSYSATTVKVVSKTIDENLLNTSDNRTGNINRELLVAGDQLTDIQSDDLILTFNALMSSKVELPSSNISSSTDITSSGVYMVDTSAGDVDITLNSNNSDLTTLIFSKISTDANAVNITTSDGVTIANSSSYIIKNNFDVTGFILNSGNYKILERYKVYEPLIISPAGNDLLYKLRVGA